MVLRHGAGLSESLVHLALTNQSLVHLLESGLFDSLLDSLQEVDDLVVYKVLVDLHFSFKVPHLALVDELQDPTCSLFDGLDILPLEVQNLSSDGGLKLSIGLVQDTLSLQVEEGGLLLNELK